MITIRPLGPRIRDSQCSQINSSLHEEINQRSSPKLQHSLSKAKMYKITIKKKPFKKNILHNTLKLQNFKTVTDPIIELIKALQCKILKKKLSFSSQQILKQHCTILLNNNQQIKIKVSKLFDIYCQHNQQKIKVWIKGGCSALSYIKPFIKMYLQLKKNSKKYYIHLNLDKDVVQSILQQYFQSDNEKLIKISDKWRTKNLPQLFNIYQQLFQRYQSVPLDLDQFQWLRQKLVLQQSFDKVNQLDKNNQITQNKSKKDILESQSFIKMKFYDNLRTQIKQLAKQTYRIINA